MLRLVRLLLINFQDMKTAELSSKKYLISGWLKFKGGNWQNSRVAKFKGGKTSNLAKISRVA